MHVDIHTQRCIYLVIVLVIIVSLVLLVNAYNSVGESCSVASFFGTYLFFLLAMLLGQKLVQDAGPSSGQ